MPSWTVEHLGRHHDRAGFSCGIPMLDDWLKRQAGQNERKDLSRTCVAVRAGEVRVRGYYSPSACQISGASLPAGHAKGMPRSIKIPALLLGRLAVDESCQNQRLGSLLLGHALRKTRDLADEIGILALTVDAIDDRARAFYLHNGFLPYIDEPDRLFLTVNVIRQLDLKPIDGG